MLLLGEGSLEKNEERGSSNKGRWNEDSNIGFDKKLNSMGLECVSCFNEVDMKREHWSGWIVSFLHNLET